MTFDDETLMAFADGELDPLMAKRVARAMAADPEIAERVAAHSALRQRVSLVYPIDSGFAPGVPDPLAALIGSSSVVAMPAGLRHARRRFLEIAALAACLVAGVAVGTQWQNGTTRPVGGALVASGSLAEALDTQLASATGEIRMLVSFKNQAGEYCRVFSDNAMSGIACKNADGWKLVRTQSPVARDPSAYRQASSEEAAVMTDAQAMMHSEPLGELAEQKARAVKWKAP